MQPTSRFTHAVQLVEYQDPSGEKNPKNALCKVRVGRPQIVAGGTCLGITAFCARYEALGTVSPNEGPIRGVHIQIK